MDMTSSRQMWGTSSMSLRFRAVCSTCAQRGGGGLCLPVTYSLGSLVNKPVFVLTMQLFKIGQLNALLFFSGPLVQSFQTNLKDNPPAVTLQSYRVKQPTKYLCLLWVPLFSYSEHWYHFVHLRLLFLGAASAG